MTGFHLDVDHELPDAGGGMCCFGSAGRGPGGCTCWEPEHDQAQAEPQEGPHAVRESMCGDCAYRKSSPERGGDERYACSGEQELDELPLTGQLFYCHDGMRKRVAMVHGPTGTRAPADTPDAYDPPRDNAHPVKADGTPAVLCAGYMAQARRLGVLT